MQCSLREMTFVRRQILHTWIVRDRLYMYTIDTYSRYCILLLVVRNKDIVLMLCRIIIIIIIIVIIVSVLSLLMSLPRSVDIPLYPHYYSHLYGRNIYSNNINLDIDRILKFIPISSYKFQTFKKIVLLIYQEISLDKQYTHHLNWNIDIYEYSQLCNLPLMLIYIIDPLISTLISVFASFATAGDCRITNV